MRRKDMPPAEFLVEARKHLPPPGPEAESMRVRVDAGPQWGMFELNFIVRRYSSGDWVWEIGSSQCLDPLQDG
jgi:hypothetical protein